MGTVLTLMFCSSEKIQDWCYEYFPCPIQEHNYTTRVAPLYTAGEFTEEPPRERTHEKYK